MTDERKFSEIAAQHPVPWVTVVIPGITNGMAQIQMVDANGQQVPLFTLLRTLELVTLSIKARQA